MPKYKKSGSVQFLGDISKTFHLPRNFYCPPTDLFNILEKRKSRHKFNAMELQDISTLLWFAQRKTASFSDPNRLKLPYPTAGALASVKTIVLRPDEEAWVYDIEGHKAEVLPASLDLCKNIRASANEFFTIDKGILLLFVVDRSFISQYYQTPDTLVLREAGVLLGTLGLLAEAFQLAYCPLGTTAEEWLINLLDTRKELIISVGAAVVGRR